MADTKFGALDPYSVGKTIERMVLADQDRPCLYGVMGPCQHPNCLEAHYRTLKAKYTSDTATEPKRG